MNWVLHSTLIQGVHYELHSTHTRCPLRTPFYTYKVFTMNTVLHIQGFHHELHSTLIQSFHQELHSTRVQNPATNQYTCLSLRIQSPATVTRFRHGLYMHKEPDRYFTLYPRLLVTLIHSLATITCFCHEVYSTLIQNPAPYYSTFLPCILILCIHIQSRFLLFSFSLRGRVVRGWPCPVQFISRSLHSAISCLTAYFLISPQALDDSSV